jgi:hypothetical protein
VRFLFRFGYCTPAQWTANEADGWDDEDAMALWILAESEQAALDWGRELAERFTRQLFERSTWEGEIPSWKASRFAHWIEKSEDELRAMESFKLRTVRVGDVPDFSEGA